MTWPQLQRAECTLDGQVVKLTRREADMLSCLLMHYPAPVPYPALIEMLWDNPDFEPEYAQKVVSIYIMRLRKKIGKHAVRTCHGVGVGVCQTKAEQEWDGWNKPKSTGKPPAKPPVQKQPPKRFIGKAVVVIDGNLHRIRHMGTNYRKVRAAVSGDVERLLHRRVPMRLSVSFAEDSAVRADTP